MRRPALCILFSLSLWALTAQDTTYARQTIRYLCSKTCFGRGYLKGGLAKAESFLIKEIKKHQGLPLFDGSYTQAFVQSVNTFPGKCEVIVNGKRLRPGFDFIPDPGAYGAKGKFTLNKVDSVTYKAEQNGTMMLLHLRNKLTYSVARRMDPFCAIDIDKQALTTEPKELFISLENKFIPEFAARNVACYLNGTSGSDSLIVFSAHYDHLGGIGKKTFFPGANDNASGVSAVLNLLKFYSTHPPRYKTLFIFFAGEEAGLLGSQYFTSHSPVALNKIKFLINIDLLGTGDDGIMVVNGAIHEKEFLRLQSLNTQQNLVKDIRKRGKASNSDHYWFSEAGVPCFFIYTLGGITAYHDVRDIAATLPLTDYVDVLRLLTNFANSF